MFLKRKIIAVLACVVAVCSLSACTNIEPDDPKDGQYATQTSMSSIEYGIYMNKQITVIINQIMGRLQGARSGQATEQELALAEETAGTMQDILDEITVTKPATTADDDRETTIMALQTAVTHMNDYKTALENGEDTRGFVEVFETDINDLTSLSNMYYQ